MQKKSVGQKHSWLSWVVRQQRNLKERNGLEMEVSTGLVAWPATSGIRSDIYLGEFIMVQAYKPDITALRRNLCPGKLGDGHTQSASIPLSEIRSSTLVFGEK